MKLAIEGLVASQQPNWADTDHLAEVVSVLEQQYPLTSPREADLLTARLGEVVSGNAFVLQAGPCAEAFSDTPESTRDLFNVILPMTVVLGYGAGVPVVKIPRIAGQFAKPRSSAMETRGEIVLPSYRGDIINDSGFSEADRRPDPNRLLLASRAR